jgi:hypothetical protein
LSCTVGFPQILWYWEGIGKGKNGQGVTFYVIDVIRINKTGKIQSVYAFWDPTPILKAIDAI